MDENKFWLSVWALIVSGLVGAIVTVGIVDAYSSYTIRQMVEKGANPVEAHCAIYGGGERNAALCVLTVQKNKE